jgi:ADP-heptose:LPS heptosyltransferase
MARFAALGRGLSESGWRVVVVLGEAERDRAEDASALTAVAAETLRCVPLSGLARRIATASAFIGNDSGVTHLAAALRVPTVAVFGPTSPAVWAPALPWVTVVGRRTDGPPDAAVEEVRGAVDAILRGLHL